jgi:integrator complex subunit 11
MKQQAKNAMFDDQNL